MKFATKFIRHYPPHLRHVATLPWEIKNSNLLQIFSRYGRNCIFNIENRLRFDKVAESLKVGTFLRHSVEGPDRGCASSYSNQQCG